MATLSSLCEHLSPIYRNFCSETYRSVITLNGHASKKDIIHISIPFSPMQENLLQEIYGVTDIDNFYKRFAAALKCEIQTQTVSENYRMPLMPPAFVSFLYTEIEPKRSGVGSDIYLVSECLHPITDSAFLHGDAATVGEICSMCHAIGCAMLDFKKAGICLGAMNLDLLAVSGIERNQIRFPHLLLSSVAVSQTEMYLHELMLFKSPSSDKSTNAEDAYVLSSLLWSLLNGYHYDIRFSESRWEIVPESIPDFLISAMKACQLRDSDALPMLIDAIEQFMDSGELSRTIIFEREDISAEFKQGPHMVEVDLETLLSAAGLSEQSVVSATHSTPINKQKQPIFPKRSTKRNLSAKHRAYILPLSITAFVLTFAITLAMTGKSAEDTAVVQQDEPTPIEVIPTVTPESVSPSPTATPIPNLSMTINDSGIAYVRPVASVISVFTDPSLLENYRLGEIQNVTMMLAVGRIIEDGHIIYRVAFESAEQLYKAYVPAEALYDTPLSESDAINELDRLGCRHFTISERDIPVPTSEFIPEATPTPTSVPTAYPSPTSAVNQSGGQSSVTDAPITTVAPTPVVPSVEFSVNPVEITVKVGETVTLRPTVSCLWNSSDNTIATINASCIVTGIAPGTCTISAYDPVSTSVVYVSVTVTE